MLHNERVAELRRRMPPGPVVDDYAFEEGPADLSAGDEPVQTVRLGELFSGPDRALVVYQFMYGKRQTEPCEMCTMWIDGFNCVADHLAQNVDFVVVAAADLPTLRAHARDRGWTNLRLLSAGSSSFKYDLDSEDAEGNQDSTVSVFTRDSDGFVRHFYSAHPGCPTTSPSGASTCSARFGTSSTSLPRAGATGTRSWPTGDRSNCGRAGRLRRDRESETEAGARVERMAPGRFLGNGVT